MIWSNFWELIKFRNLYKTENILLIGGIQDKGKGNNMQLLFYKQDRVPGQKEQPAGYNLEISCHEGYQHQTGIEQFINEQQMINNKVLRSIVCFEEATRKTFFVAL